MYVRDHTYNVTRLTVGFLVHSIEGLPPQLAVAGHADEAVHMEDLVHGGAARSLSHHILATASTSTWREHKPFFRPTNYNTTHKKVNEHETISPEHAPLPKTHWEILSHSYTPRMLQIIRVQLTEQMIDDDLLNRCYSRWHYI